MPAPSLAARALATGFALSIAVASATPVQAQTITLVDNWDVGSRADSLAALNTAYAQGFTTGPHAEGYELTRIELDWEVANKNWDHGRMVLRLRQSSSNKPGGRRWDFQTTTHHYSDFNSTGTKTFRPAAAVVPILEPNTTYYVTLLPLNLRSDEAALGARDAISASSSSATSWTLQRYLAGTVSGFSNPATWTEAADDLAIRIHIKGKELTPLTSEAIKKDPERDAQGRLRHVFDLELSPGSRSPGVRWSKEQMSSLIQATTTNLQEVLVEKVRNQRVWNPRSGSVVTVTNHWRLKLLPDDPTQPVTVEILPDQGCDPATGGLCQVGGGQLSDTLTVSFAPFPQLSVSDAEGTEGVDASLDFQVTLSPAASERVTVRYATSNGTAIAGSDYTNTRGTLRFDAGEMTKTISVPIIDDAVEDDGETVNLTLSNASGAEIADGEAVGTIRNSETQAPDPLTASFDSVPASHTGAPFTFILNFSENVGVLSYRTLRDAAFNVTGGSVTKAKRRTNGSTRNQHWNITVKPASSNDQVTITLPETTDCSASGAICTSDGRKLSNSPTATVAAPASSTAGDAANGPVEDDRVDDALALADGLTPDDAAQALFGEQSLTVAQLAALDRLGNGNGSFDLGDVLSWIERCRRGEARCGGTSTDVGPAGAAALLAAVRGRGTSGRTGGRAPRPRGRTPMRRTRHRAGMARCAIGVLLATILTWSCTDGSAGPVAPVAAEPDPGFLTVELTAPAGHRDIGVLLELEGPGIESVQARGLELYESVAPERHQVILAGSIEAGPLMQFHVPDRNQLALYRVHVVQVTGQDYGLREAGEYRTLTTN